MRRSRKEHGLNPTPGSRTRSNASASVAPGWVVFGGFSPLQFCLTEKTLSSANEAPIWGWQLGPGHEHRQLGIESKGNGYERSPCLQ